MPPAAERRLRSFSPGVDSRQQRALPIIRTGNNLPWNALHIAAWSGDLANAAEALGSCQIDVDAAVVISIFTWAACVIHAYA